MTTNAHMRDYLAFQRLLLHMANHCTKFGVSSFSRPNDILGRLKFNKGHLTIIMPILDVICHPIGNT